MKQPGLDKRHRDESGEISRKNSVKSLPRAIGPTPSGNRT
jgi:hypothetical protein